MARSLEFTDILGRISETAIRCNGNAASGHRFTLWDQAMVKSNVAPPVWHIYKVTCSASNKSYIGLTRCGVERRWRNHIWRVNSKRPMGEKFHLHRAIAKYGVETFSVQTLSEHPTLVEASAAERAAIASHGTLNPNGYNFTDGGMGTPGLRSPHSQATKDKIGAAHRGKTASMETRKRMSEARKGWVPSASLREAVSRASRGRAIPQHVRDKIAKAHIGKTVHLTSLSRLRFELARHDAGTSKSFRQESRTRWSTRLTMDGKRKHLGMFPTKILAQAAYRRALVRRIQHFEKLIAAHQ